MPTKNYELLMRSLELPQFHTITDLAALTGLSGSLLYCLSQQSDRYYRTFNVAKKSGGVRTIQSPSYTMHIVQRWILRNILDKVRPTKYAMAFRRGQAYGCKANAMHHIETHYGISIDLKDFFPSITANRIYHVFSNIGYDSLPATILTNLCTLDGHLPQGGACSPALSNLVCISLDSRLGGLCEKRRIRFSRYADDMYFSCDNQDVLKKTVPIIRKIIQGEGFTINESKVNYHTPSNKKVITGITVSRKDTPLASPQLKASKSLKRRIRAEIFKSIFTGDYSRSDRILGEIAYVNYIEPGYKQCICQYVEATAKKVNIFPELVEQYNANRFYNALPKVEVYSLKSIEAENSMHNYILYLECVYVERRQYLDKVGVADICTYQNWPDILQINRASANEISDDELPF